MKEINLSNFDLSTKEGRKEAYQYLIESATSDFKYIGIELYKNISIKIYDDSIHISIRDLISAIENKTYLGSGVEISRLENGNGYDYSISYGSTGSFNPKEDIGSCWRTYHAANIITYWDDVTKIVNKYCTLYCQMLNKTN